MLPPALACATCRVKDKTRVPFTKVCLLFGPSENKSMQILGNATSTTFLQLQVSVTSGTILFSELQTYMCHS